MRRTTGLSVVILIVLISLPAAALAAAWGKGYLAPEAAAPQAVYTLSWWTVDGGGTTFNAQEGYRLGGTIGVDCFSAPDKVSHHDIVYAKGSPIVCKKLEFVFEDGSRKAGIIDGEIVL